MNDPKRELVNVVESLTLAPSVISQRSTISKYFIRDASFLHPLCSVNPGPGSREKIAGIYEWYRDMSPDISLEVESFVYDEAQNIAYLNVVQVFHIFLSPFKPTPTRLLVKVILQKSELDGKYYIVRQEDYYQPEEILHLTLPFLATPLVYLKRLAGSVCGVNALVFAYARDLAHKGLEVLGARQKQPVIVDHVRQD